MSNDLLGGLLLLMWVGFACLLGWRVLRAFWATHCPRITTLGRVGTVALIMLVAAAGADKTPALRALTTLITVLQGGELLDPSGRIGSASRAAVAQSILEASGDIIAAASNTVAESQFMFDQAAATLTNRELRVAYLSADLPRALPGVHTNHNIAATIQRTRQDGATNLLAWVWFSEEPTIVPQVALSYSVSSNAWAYFPAVTNSYPDTVAVDGIPCVVYRYAIPEAVRGIVFKPEYDLYFGGEGDGEYLVVPSGGLMISTNGVECLPYEGIDVYSENLSVTFRGGVAVAARYYGTNYTGVANQ